MGKGFHNFMSKKDFHPSAIWNLKKVWMAQQKQDEDKTKQEAMRVQYEKEQELINNKALLGDEKARLGLAFMYEPPTGLRKEENEQELKAEPKFEWQRKYNAPRESWAKGDENVMDQPFGIMVRNVRCVKCHKWGHTNTDRECPLFNMSGNYDDPGISNNPSELIKEMRKVKDSQEDLNEKRAAMRDRLPTEFLNEHMKSEYGLTLRKNVIGTFTSDEKLAVIARRKDKIEEEPTSSKSKPESSRKVDATPKNEQMAAFLSSLSDKEKSKIFKKFFSMNHGDGDEKKKSKSKKDRKKKNRKDIESRKRKRSDSDSDSSSSDEDSSKLETSVRGKRSEEKSGRRNRSRSGSRSRIEKRSRDEMKSKVNSRESRDRRGRHSNSRSRSREHVSHRRSELKSRR